MRTILAAATLAGAALLTLPATPATAVHECVDTFLQADVDDPIVETGPGSITVHYPDVVWLVACVY
jgi:hypothetical protein